MALEDNLLPTPAGYATPEQLKAVREYAKAQLYGGLQQPVHHWTQGVSNMVNALYGGKGLYDANVLERGTDVGASRAITDVPIPNDPQAGGPRASLEEPATPARTPNRAVAEEPLRPTPVKTTAFAPESAGAAGLTQDQFEGRFPPAGLDGIPTPSPFMANPKGSAAMLRFNALNDPGSLVPPDAPAAIARALARGNGPQTTGFGGGPQALPFDAEVSVAANTKAAPAPGKGMPTAAPAGSPAENIVEPSTVPHRAQISKGQLEGILTNPRIPQALKETYIQMYMQQFQPVEAETVGGKVVIGPDGKQRRVPAVGTNPIEVGSPGGGSYKGQEPSMLVPDPANPGGYKRVIIPTERPGIGAAPGQGGAPGGPPPIPSIKDLKGKKSEAAPKAAPEQDINTLSEAAPGKPVQLAFAGDELPPGMLGTKPPGFPTQPVGPEAAGKAGAEGKLAQNSLIPPDVSATMSDLQQRGLDYERNKEFNKKDVDSFDKSYTDLADAGQRAAVGMPQLEMLQNIVSDPKFYSGIGGNEIVLPYKQLQAQFGKDPAAAAAMEVFRKGVSQQIVEDMKIMLKGLGQVRVAEIDLLSKASASLNNTRPANAAVIELAIRAHKQIDGLSKVANAYRDGWTMGKDGDWERNAGPPTKAGLDSLMKRYAEAQPTLSPEERKHYETLFGKYDQAKAAKIKADLESAQGSPGSGTPSTGTKAPPPPPGFR